MSGGGGVAQCGSERCVVMAGVVTLSRVRVGGGLAATKG